MYISTVNIVKVCPNLLLPSRSGDFKKNIPVKVTQLKSTDGKISKIT